MEDIQRVQQEVEAIERRKLMDKEKQKEDEDLNEENDGSDAG